MRLLALALVACALSGCETTAEKSAKLEREAKSRPGYGRIAQKGLSISTQSTAIRVLGTAVVSSSEGNAVVVTLRNDSSRAMREVPVEVTLHDSHGVALYTNSTAGLAHTLVSASLIGAGGELEWIDDQIPRSGGSGAPTSATARIGEGEPVAGPIPQISVQGAHLIEDPANGIGAKGAVVNHSALTQTELVVYAVARRAGRIVAAGRAVLAQVPAGASTPFQLFFIGDPRGARLYLQAPPSTVG